MFDLPETSVAVRELRVTDIRCRRRGCDAGPGEPCITGDHRVVAHPDRIDEHAALVALGWQWQEVYRLDRGAGRDERERKRSGRW